MSASNIEAFKAGKPGEYEGVPAEIYFALGACSASALKQFARSPAHCKYAMDHPTEPTPAMVLGTAVHAAVLQPELFDGLYVAAGRCSARKKDNAPCSHPGKFMVGGDWLCGVHVKSNRHEAIFAAIAGSLEAQGMTLTHTSEFGSRYYAAGGRLARVSDHAPSVASLRRMLADGRESFRVDLPPYGSDDPRTVLSPDQLESVRGMRDAVLSHKDAARALADGRRELSILWRDGRTGVLCKMRADHVGDDVAWDLKTTTDASPEEFAWSVRRRKYDLQAAFYLRGLAAAGMPREGFGFIPVESEPPHPAALYVLDDSDMEDADESAFGAGGLLEEYAECQRSGRWGGYAEGMTILKLPPKRSAVVEV